VKIDEDFFSEDSRVPNLVQMHHNWYMHLSRPLEDLLSNNFALVIRRMAMVSDELSGRRIAYLSGVPPVSAARVLSTLVEVGLVKSRYLGQSKVYQLNRDHVLWGGLELILGSAARVEARIVELTTSFAPRSTTVAVFGSFARGDAGPQSDIDIVLVSKDEADPDRRFDLADALSVQLATFTGNSVDIIDIVDADLENLVLSDDALVSSWNADARTVHGPDLKSRIRSMIAE